MISRRGFLNYISAGTALYGLGFSSSGVYGASNGLPFDRLPFTPDQPEPLKVPEDKRIPFEKDYFSLDNSEDGLLIRFAESISGGSKTSAVLRLHIAIDTREKDEVTVFLAKSGKRVGQLSIWYATAMQLFETELEATAAEVIAEGLILRKSCCEKPLFIFSSGDGFGSHLLVYENSKKNAYPESLYSAYSLQPFGWLEGCVLDGLYELYDRKNDQRAMEALKFHTSQFVKPEGGLIYEDPHGRPSDHKFVNLEAGLPFSTIARLYPDHPSVSWFVAYCKNRIDENKNVRDNFLSTEGCYTIAYPLAVTARELAMPELFELSLIELAARIDRLTDQDAVYTRGWKDRGLKTYRNWGRGYTWFLLGLVRTIEILQKDSPFKDDSRLKRLKEAYQHFAGVALSHQQADHGWRAYLDLEETPYDASATAGLGAALSHGYRLKLLPDLSKNQLKNIRTRLQSSLTPDGFLRDICQQNAAGEALQKSEYRVIAQYVLGLKAHIEAVL